MTTLAVLRWLGWRGVLALALLALLAVQTIRLGTAQYEAARDGRRAAENVANAARSALAESEAMRAKDHERAESVNRIADAYERGKQEADEQEKRLVADLRAGSVRLRDLWRGCEARRVSDPAADPGVADAEDRLRFESAARIDRAIVGCQNERDALLKIAEDDRKP